MAERSEAKSAKRQKSKFEIFWRDISRFSFATLSMFKKFNWSLFPQGLTLFSKRNEYLKSHMSNRHGIVHPKDCKRTKHPSSSPSLALDNGESSLLSRYFYILPRTVVSIDALTLELRDSLARLLFYAWVERWRQYETIFRRWSGRAGKQTQDKLLFQE